MKGYWIKFNSNEIISLHGNFVTREYNKCLNGWNMIGPFDKIIDVNSITTQPPNLISFTILRFWKWVLCS